MNLSRQSGLFLAAATAFSLTAGANAPGAVIGTATLIKEPPATPFANSPAGVIDSQLGAPWVSYRLSLTADGGDLIQAVEMSISGQLHQRWVSSNVDGVYDTPTGNSTNATNADSHFMATSTMLFASGPTEDNPFTGSPLSPMNDADLGYGVGTNMSATFGIPGTGLTSMNVAYIVIPRGSEPLLDIRVKVFDPEGDVISIITPCDFGGCPPPSPPVVGDLGPLIPDFENTPPHVPVIVSGTLPATDDRPISELVWEFVGDPIGPGPVGFSPTLDPATGLFSWNVDGSRPGLYLFSIRATDRDGLSDTGILSVSFIPEPATNALLALAFFGMTSFARCRSSTHHSRDLVILHF